MNINLKGRSVDVYCDLCAWQGVVTIPTHYIAPSCAPMEQSCPYCGRCYLHLAPRVNAPDVVTGYAYNDYSPEAPDEE